VLRTFPKQSICRPQVAICPTCHRPIQYWQFQVSWPPIKAAILGLLAQRGELGASTAEIINECYDGRRKPKPSCIKSHIWQINDVLEDEAPEWRIVRDGGRWELRRTRRRGP
jgi:hypothetical protein